MIFVLDIRTCYCYILSVHSRINYAVCEITVFNGYVFQYNKTVTHLEPLNIRNVHYFLHFSYEICSKGYFIVILNTNHWAMFFLYSVRYWIIWFITNQLSNNNRTGSICLTLTIKKLVCSTKLELLQMCDTNLHLFFYAFIWRLSYLDDLHCLDYHLDQNYDSYQHTLDWDRETAWPLPFRGWPIIFISLNMYMYVVLHKF